jgi:ABC-type transport system involved in cytochrome bd biosynthesis fused ATPase/permease subunit
MDKHADTTVHIRTRTDRQISTDTQITQSQTCTHTLTQRSHLQTTAVRDNVHNNNQKGGDRADIRVERRLALASLCRWHGSTPTTQLNSLITGTNGGQKILEFSQKRSSVLIF